MPADFYHILLFHPAMLPYPTYTDRSIAFSYLNVPHFARPILLLLIVVISKIPSWFNCCSLDPFHYYKNYFIPRSRKNLKESVSYRHKTQSQGKIFSELFQSQHHKKKFLREGVILQDLETHEDKPPWQAWGTTSLISTSEQQIISLFSYFPTCKRKPQLQVGGRVQSLPWELCCHHSCSDGLG